MIRCPQCHQANAEGQMRCFSCGQALPKPWRKPVDLSALFEPAVAARAALLCTGLLGFYGLLFNWLTPWPRDWAARSSFQILSGLCLGLGLAWLQGGGLKRWFYWGLAGLLAGAAAFAVDWLYNYHYQIYRTVFFIADWISPLHSSLFPFLLLQALRYWALCLVLLAADLLLHPRLSRLSLGFVACLLAAVLRFHVYGLPLLPFRFEQLFSSPAWASWQGDGEAAKRLLHLAYYFSSQWLVLYVLAKRVH